MRICRFVVVLLWLVPFSATSGELDKVITICGSGDNQALLRDLAQAYEKNHPGSRLEVPDSIGSSGGIKATAKGQCDLGRTARPLKAKEKKYGLNYKMFARSPVVFVVSDNLKSIKNLSSEQVVGIFSGKITSWQDVGGPDEKIYVANREKGDSSRSIIEKHLIDFALIKNPVGKTIYTTPEAVDIVARHKNTIAYCPLSAAQKADNVRVVSFQGISADLENVTSGKYPLFSEFGLVWRNKRSDNVRGFLTFIETPQSIEIIKKFGSSPVFRGNK